MICWHQTLKNRILLENYFLPGDLEAQIAAFVEHYNHQCYHESLNNVTPADAYSGRAAAIIKQRERIKRQTIEHRRLHHRKLAAQHQPPDEADTPLIYTPNCAKCSDDGQLPTERFWRLNHFSSNGEKCTTDRRMVNTYAALGHYFFQISQAQAVGQIPPYT